MLLSSRKLPQENKKGTGTLSGGQKYISYGIYQRAGDCLWLVERKNQRRVKKFDEEGQIKASCGKIYKKGGVK